MAQPVKHPTHKRTAQGRTQTLQRKVARQAKRVASFDIDALNRELVAR